MINQFNLFVLIGFKITWLSCILGEIYINSFFGLIIGVIYLFIFFHYQKNLKRSFYIIIFFSFIGYTFDSFLSFFEIYQIKAQLNFLFLPIWFLVLWPSFSCLLVEIFIFLKNKNILSLLLGGIFGPISYYAGVSLNLVESSNYKTFIIISIFWSLMMFFYSSIVLRKLSK